MFWNKFWGDIVNKKGQALVEFVLIIPILIMVLFVVIDFGKIYYTKITLSGKLSDVEKLYKSGKNINDIKKLLNDKTTEIDVSILEENDYISYNIEQKINIITPGLNVIIGNPFSVKESLIIYAK